MLGAVSELNPGVCLVLQTQLSVSCSHLARGHAGRRERLQKVLHLNAKPHMHGGGSGGGGGSCLPE